MRGGTENTGKSSVSCFCRAMLAFLQQRTLYPVALRSSRLCSKQCVDVCLSLAVVVVLGYLSHATVGFIKPQPRRAPLRLRLRRILTSSLATVARVASISLVSLDFVSTITRLHASRTARSLSWHGMTAAIATPVPHS